MCIYDGQPLDGEWIKQAVEKLPKEPQINNLYNTLYYHLVKFYMMGARDKKYYDDFSKWSKKLKKVLFNKQVKHGRNKGSWRMNNKNFKFWGRTGDTAIAILILEVYFRYEISSKD